MTPVKTAEPRSYVSDGADQKVRQVTPSGNRVPGEWAPVRRNRTSGSPPGGTRANIAFAHDWECVAGLRRGDEDAFEQLVHRYHSQLIRLAASYIRDKAVAEEVVQDTWIAVICGIDRFEGRSSFKTWLFRIMTNIAKKRAVREHRSVPWSALGTADDEEGTTALDADRFFPDGNVWAGHWAASPASWGARPMDRLLASECQRVIDDAIERLPAPQRRVITLRDVDGWSPEDVCGALGITEGNHRVLLHRARTTVRAAIDAYLAPRSAPPARDETAGGAPQIT